MFKFMGNKRLLFLMLAFMFFIALMGYTFVNRAPMTWPQKFTKDTISFTQGLIYKPAGYIAGLFEDIHLLFVVYEENKVLKLTLTQYAKDKARLNDLQAQNERLKTALAFTDRQKRANDYKWRIAEVIGVSPERFNNTIVVNLGEKDGVKENMAVATADGLLGRVIQVSAFYSNVQLITDINEKVNYTKAISATVLGKTSEDLSESFGMVESYVLNEGIDLEQQVIDQYDLGQQEGFLVMSKISITDTMEIGDIVVTSGLGEVFPRGIVIGTIISKKVGEFGLTHTALIKPAAEFRHLREVFIVEVPGQ